MTRLIGPVSVLLLALVACTDETGPALSTSDVRILAPVPGSSAGVAYLTISNGSDTSIAVHKIESPQYADVQMHETTIVDGVARMEPMPTLNIEAGTSAQFAPGGKHIMLMRPLTNVGPGTLVALEIHHDAGILIINATMHSRLPSD